MALQQGGPKTLEEIALLPKQMLLATDISSYLEIDPGIIRWQAQHDPDKLGFPVIVVKSRVKIPKAGFLEYCQHGRPVKLDYELMSDRVAAKVMMRMVKAP